MYVVDTNSTTEKMATSFLETPTCVGCHGPGAKLGEVGPQMECAAWAGGLQGAYGEDSPAVCAAGVDELSDVRRGMRAGK